MLKPFTGDFCILQQKWTGQFFTQLQIWPMELQLLCISKLVVGTPELGKYLYLYESRELIFSNPLLITTSTLHCCLTDPAPKGYKTKLQCWAGGRLQQDTHTSLDLVKSHLHCQCTTGSKQHHSQIQRWYLI